MRQQNQSLTSEQIKELIDGYQARGEQTRPEFCQARGLTLYRFDYYMRRYRKEFGPAPARMVRVAVESPMKPGAVFALVLANGRRIECGEADLPRLIRVAESR